MDVSIILVNYNTKDLTRNCIKSVYENTKGVEFEIIVVDNNSHDGSIEMIEHEFPEVKLIKNPENNGFGAANNIAISQSNAKYVFLLNTDTLLIGNPIKYFFDYMEKEDNKNVAVCNGIMYHPDKTKFYLEFNFPFFIDLSAIFGKKEQDLSYDQEVDWACGADFFVRKSVLDEVGTFDENFFMYYEETDLCKRIKQHGYSIKFLSVDTIIHFESSSIQCDKSINIKKLKISSQSMYYYYKKHYGIWTTPAIMLTLSIFHIIKFIFTFNKDELKKLYIKINPYK